MFLTAEEIHEEAKRRKAVSAKRMDIYNRSRQAYYGDREETGVQGMDNSGRTILRVQQLRNSLASRTGAPNMLLPIVDDFVGLKGTLPNMKVTPWDDTDDAREKAAKFGRVLRTQYKQSKMDMQFYKFAWFMSALGDCLLTLNPTFPDQATPFRRPGIYINVVDPSTCFPQFKTGWESEEMRDVIIWERFTREQAKAEWGISSTEERVDAFWYISDDYNCLTVGGNTVSSVSHNLGFCPAQWVKNKLNGRPAQSDIYAAIEAHEEMQVMVTVMNDSLLETTYGQLVIKNPANVQDDFEVGPGAEPIVIQGDGDVTRLAPSPPPQSAQMLMQNMWELIQRIAGSAPVRTENAIPGSNISGRSVHAQQAPMETRLAGWQTVVGNHLEALNEKILWMLYTIPEFKNQIMNIWGTEKGKPFNVQFQGAELDGWTRNSVQWSAIIGSTAHERSVVGIALKDKDLVPDEWVLDQIGIEDSDFLVSQAKAEMKDKMALQQQMQGPPAGQQAGPPPAQAPPGGDTGSPAAQPPPEGGGGMPPFPPVDQSPTTTGFGTPSPVPDVWGQIQEVLGQVADQLTGQVVNATPQGHGVHITMSHEGKSGMAQDRAILRQAFEAVGMKVTFSNAD